MNEVYEKTFRIKGWFDETATIQGWFGEDFADTLGPSTQAITLPLIGPEEVTYTPTVTRGAVTIIPWKNNRDQDSFLYPPTVRNYQIIQLPWIPTTNTLYGALLRQNILLATISAEEVVYTPSVASTYALLLPIITSGSVEVPTVDTTAPTLYTPYIPSEEVVYSPYRVEKPRKVYTGVGWS